MDISANEVWFVTGSQHLYGPETLATVAEHSAAIAAALDAAPGIPVTVVIKPVLTGADEIRRLCQAANASDACIGLVTWMHTFSPAKMWIAGLGGLQKPFLHLHTQFNDEIPCAGFAMIGDEQIGAQIVETIGRSPAVLLKNHGVFTVGPSAAAAVKAAVMTEDVAATVWAALQLGQPDTLPDDVVARLHERYTTQYGQ